MYNEHVKKCNKKGVFIEISLIMNIFLILNDLKMFVDSVIASENGEFI